MCPSLFAQPLPQQTNPVTQTTGDKKKQAMAMFKDRLKGMTFGAESTSLTTPLGDPGFGENAKKQQAGAGGVGQGNGAKPTATAGNSTGARTVLGGQRSA